MQDDSLKRKITELQKNRAALDKKAHELFATDKFCQSDIIRIIIPHIADYFEIEIDTLYNYNISRDDNNVLARHTLYYLCSVYTSYSNHALGKELNATDSSMCRGIRRINELDVRFKQNLVLFSAIENMKKKIESDILTNLLPKIK